MPLPLRLAVLAVVVALAPRAFAQSEAARATTPSAATAVQDKRAKSFNEIERGVFAEVSGGYWAIINPPATVAAQRRFSSGQSVAVDLGFDVGERIAPSLFFLGAANRMGSDYAGLSTDVAPASGDFGAFVPGARVKIRIVGFDDSQDVRRVWVYARAGAGYVFYVPTLLLPRTDVLVTAGAGVEYFTRLRHFSIGVEAAFNAMLLTGTFGFSVFPSVRYAF